MNTDEVEILRGWELALKAISGRLDDLSRIYRVLNDAHIDTQVNLESIKTTQQYLVESMKRDSNRLSNLEDRYNVLETSLKTALSIIKWIVTPGVALNFAFQVFVWWSNSIK